MKINGEDIVSIKEVEVNIDNLINYLEITLKNGKVINYVPRAEAGYTAWLSIEETEDLKEEFELD
jgi:hypothetical protein